MARRLGPSRWVQAWLRRRLRRAGEQPGTRRVPQPGTGDGRRPRAPAGGGRWSFVWSSGGALAFVPIPWRCGLEGRGRGQRWALAPGASVETIGGVSRPLHLPPGGRGCSGGPHCLKESEAGGARAAEGRRPPGLPGLRGGGPGQLWALRQWVEAVRPSPLQPPQGCVFAWCFWRELGGRRPRAASPRGAGPPRRTVGPAHSVAAHARGLPSVERFAEIRKGAGSRGAGPGAGA